MTGLNSRSHVRILLPPGQEVELPLDGPLLHRPRPEIGDMALLHSCSAGDHQRATDDNAWALPELYAVADTWRAMQCQI